MSRIFLVRHGQTIWHTENRYAGSSNVPLTEHGLQQAQALGEWCKTAELTHLYVSPLQRARDTVASAEQATGLRAQVDERLREVHFGVAEGLTAKELQKQIPEAWEAFLLNPVEHFLPDGEDPQSAASRARRSINEIAEMCGPEARVLIVAHNTLFRLLLCDLLGVPLSQYRSLLPALRNAAVTELEIGPGKLALYSFNVPLHSSC